MNKWENIIKGLECCSVPPKNRYCDSCPIGFGDGCRLKLKRAALALLKAQESETLDVPKLDDNIGCWYDITHNYTLEQVVSALKAQKPRVLTLEEVRCAYEEPMWFESKGTFRGQKGFWVLSKGVSPSYVIRLIPAIGKDDTELSLTAYSKVWRCWTSRPTDEQREATPWN